MPEDGGTAISLKPLPKDGISVFIFTIDNIFYHRLLIRVFIIFCGDLFTNKTLLVVSLFIGNVQKYKNKSLFYTVFKLKNKIKNTIFFPPISPKITYIIKNNICGLHLKVYQYYFHLW